MFIFYIRFKAVIIIYICCLYMNSGIMLYFEILIGDILLRIIISRIYLHKLNGEKMVYNYEDIRI